MSRNKALIPMLLSMLGGVAAGSTMLYFTIKPPATGEMAQVAEETQDDPTDAGSRAIDECDELAAHPGDPDATVAGVDDESLDAKAGIAACEAALEADPSEPRLRFQLARSYLAADRVEDAAEQLVTAAEAGHGGALAYLADMHLDGAGGLEADPKLAVTLYEKAVGAGFEPAQAVLAELQEAEPESEPAPEATPVAQAAPAPAQSRTPPKYNNPEIIDNIMRGDLDAVPFGEIYTKSYLVNMADNISAACEGQHFTRRELDELKLDAAFKTVEVTPEAGLNALFGALMGAAKMVQNPAQAMERSARAEMNANALPEEAMKDAFALVSHHGCGSPAINKFGGHLRSYIVDEGAPRMSTDQLFGKCVSEANPTGRYDAQNFCMCFMGLMTQTGISRATRKGLASNFWPTAQAMMEKDPGHFGTCIHGYN